VTLAAFPKIELHVHLEGTIRPARPPCAARSTRWARRIAEDYDWRSLR
jgi:hypothetical protein